MIILDIEQGTEEWLAARAGIPTASNFDKIITTTGKPSTQAKKYMLQLAGERLLGAKEETYQSAAMSRGVELEEEARRLFEMIQEVEVDEVGLCYKNEDKQFSCSPDGLFSDSGLEIKCPSLAVHIGYLLGGKCPSTYYQQVQGSMYVTGRDTWWFMSYYPGIKPLILECHKNESFHRHLEELLGRFCADLDQTYYNLNEL